MKRYEDAALGASLRYSTPEREFTSKKIALALVSGAM